MGVAWPSRPISLYEAKCHLATAAQLHLPTCHPVRMTYCPLAAKQQRLGGPGTDYCQYQCIKPVTGSSPAHPLQASKRRGRPQHQLITRSAALPLAVIPILMRTDGAACKVFTPMITHLDQQWAGLVVNKNVHTAASRCGTTPHVSFGTHAQLPPPVRTPLSSSTFNTCFGCTAFCLSRIPPAVPNSSISDQQLFHSSQGGVRTVAGVNSARFHWQECGCQGT